jgi:hypothetical protein
MELDSLSAPLLADPALVCVCPDVAALDVATTQHSGEDDLAHVTGCRISQQQIVGNLIDTNKEQRDFSRSLVLGLGQCILLHSLFDSLNFKTVLC